MPDPLAFLEAPFPMVALYKTMNTDDARRLEWGNQLADDPMLIGEAFQRTREALADYFNPEPFYDRARPKHPIARELRETKDVALRLEPPGSWHAVRGTEDVGLALGELDFAYLDRELEMLRTTKHHRQPDFDRPAKMVLDVLLCSSDGTPIVGEIKVKRDRDLTYALIQALACVSQLATKHQLDRLRLHYRDRVNRPLAAEPRFDLYLLAVPRTGGDTYLSDLDALAADLAAALLVQPSIAAVVRRIVAIRTELRDDGLCLQAGWTRQAPDSASPIRKPTLFEIGHVKAVRRSCRARAEITSSGPEGWSIGDVNPAKLVRCFPPLSLKPRFELHAYQYRADGNGNGVVWAVPGGTVAAEARELGAVDDLASPPRPLHAVDDFMSAIHGDGSAWSYLCASILARELQELGALWHGCMWSDETVIAAPPWTQPACSDGAWEIADTSPEDWQLRQPLPHDWRPHVFRDGTAVVVRFYTYSPVGTATVYEYEDRYDGSGFTFQSRRLEVATGPGGIVY